MRLKVLTLTTAATVLFLVGCSGGGGDSSFSNAQTIVAIDVNCAGATIANISTYITLQSGDSVVKDDSNTTIKIYHDVNGIKKVCLVSGSAHIVR